MDDLYSYLWQSSSIIAIWILLYKLIFNKITYFKTNRIYLLVGLLFSFSIPLLNFESALAFAFSTKYIENQNLTIKYYNNSNTQQVDYNTSTFIAQSSSKQLPTNNIDWDYSQIIYIIYLIGLSFFLLKLVYNSTKLIKNINSNIYRKETYKNIKCIVTKDKIPAFSFFNTIYISESDFTSIHSKNILEHELIHIKQNHSLDLILIETLKLFLWFNPLLYYYSKCIKDNHEFEVDNTIIQNHSDKSSYYISLVDHTLGAHFVDLPSYFNKSTLKRRFEMLNTRKSSKFSLIKYTTIIPLIAVFFFLFSCSKPDQISNNNNDIDIPKNKTKYFDCDIDAEPNGGLFSFQNLAKKQIPDILGLNYKENAAEFTFSFNVLESGSLSDVRITDTNWIQNVPSIELQKEYAAKVYKYFVNQTWHPAIANGKTKKVSRAMSVFYGTDEMWNTIHQPSIITTRSNNYKDYILRIKIPELQSSKQTYFPLVLDMKKCIYLMKNIKQNNTLNESRKTFISNIEFIVDKQGRISEVKTINNDAKYPELKSIADKLVIDEIKKMNFSPKKTNGQSVDTKLNLEIVFIYQKDTDEEYLKSLDINYFIDPKTIQFSFYY